VHEGLDSRRFGDHRSPTDTRGPAWPWPALAAIVSLIPVLPGLSGTRVFYTRDLSEFFWGRYLWLRREWLSGYWPLWDPHVGAGQSAYVDALHQMFLAPALLLRLLGNEALGFNLWIVAPFPIAAVGTWLFLARHCSRAAALLGAIAFATCGPVVSSGDFPNLSWTVALIPWVLWSVDRLVESLRPRQVAFTSFAVATQCLAGEPVTLFTTIGLAMAWALTMGPFDSGRSKIRRAVARVLTTCGAVIMGLALSAVQLLPMIRASMMAERGATIVPDTWSLRPTALLETIWLHLFGNYFEAQSLSQVPWMALMYTGREPLLFSIYLGVPLLALAIYGLAGTAPRRFRIFWVVAGFVSLFGAFGSFTPIYPILRDHVPPFGTFRFPVKYIYVAIFGLAAGAALGFDQLMSRELSDPDPVNERRAKRAFIASAGFAVITAAALASLVFACVWQPAKMGAALQAFAVLLGGDDDGKAGAFMLRTIRGGATAVIGLALAAALPLLIRQKRSSGAAVAGSWMMAGLITCDLLVHAWGVNPVIDVSRFDPPAWLAQTTGDANSRFYVGGKLGGTLNPMDFDASRGFEQVPGLTASGSRATLSVQAAFYPSGWGGRELLSYDLPVIWPRLFYTTTKQFSEATREERDRFLDRTAIRFRILPQRRAANRTPIMAVPQFYESFLFDFGDVAAARASIVADVQVMSDPESQVHALFAAGWDSRRTALIAHDLPAAGTPGAPEIPHAAIVVDEANRTVVDAAAGPAGGYLVLLDSYSDDWAVSVDSHPSEMVRANGLFRAVHLTAGAHSVEFSYRPRTLWVATAISGMALLCTGLMVIDRRRVTTLATACAEATALSAAEPAELTS
jgi:hypothetical protein